MPIRTASLSGRIKRNGAKLHLATSSRIHSLGADHEPSAAEQALGEERRQLKEERAKREAQAQQPKADKLVRTHHAQAKDKPKSRPEPKEPKASKGQKPSRAEKHATKAAALEAARMATKKSAKT